MRIILLLSIVFTTSMLNSQDYFSDRLYVKLKEEYKTNYVLDKDTRLLKLLSSSEIVSAKPVSKHPLLSSTYELILDRDANLDSLILHLNQYQEIDFAEKVPFYTLFFTPNDPLYSTQWNLAKIQADLAWNLGTGCSQVKIAVTDDGFLMNHEDLVNQWHINTGEINGNGIDDDANGYIDDWRGWDAANNDNDPSATAPTNTYFTHGTHVAGIIAGQTHNSKGIAAIGYNCKMIPVKLGLSSNSALTGAFQGLDYAVNASGCDVINMSWGGRGVSATYQTLFNIARSKGIICVAAAGNSWTNVGGPYPNPGFYPASYNHVISVAASGNSDVKAGFSNFGATIDVTAPGVDIQSCLAGTTNSYGLMSGTSMASPLVAGLCGLMKCYNPMPADSIEACLKRTCDNINAQNPSFIGQLGAGRINAFQALQCLTKKPKSDFIALDTFQCIGKSVRYAAKSFGIPTLTYNWSFPGGTPVSSTIANPIVTYSSNGYKSATLITCNSLGCDTITKTNVVNIDTPKASLIGRKYTSYNSNPVLVTIKFTGNPPYSVTLTDGTNTWTQSNIKANPYFFSIVPKKDTSLILISAFSDSLCIGNRYGVDTIFRVTLGGGGNPQYCETSFKFNGASNCVVKIDKQNGANWKDLYSTNGFTWECWFNLGNRTGASVTGTESLVGATDNQLCEDIGFHFNWPWSGSGKFNWVVSGQTGCSAPKGVVGTNMTFSANTWYHAAGVMNYTTNTMQLYVNGNLVNSGTLTIPMSQRMQNNVAVTIGNQDVNFNPYHTFTPFNGKIDEVRIWNSVRTASEIQSSYKSCIPASTPNLVAYFKADEGTGTNTVSLVNGNFIGTLQNGASWDTQVDSVKNCTLCPNNLCRDSLEINSAQTGWQALQTNGSWGSLSACNYVTSLFTANASNFPGMVIGDCLWGPIVSNPSRTYYNSPSQTTTSTSNANIAVFRKQLSIPQGAILDSVRLWMLSDDFVDSVLINNNLIYNTPIPITYGQVLFTKKEANVGTALSTNYVYIKAGDFGGNYGHYFRMKVYYSKVCGNSPSDCDTNGLVLCMSMDGNANDSTKYAHHGIIRGATPTNNRFGSSNSAYAFNGISNYINLGNKSLLKPNKATISMWVKPNTPSTTGYGYAFNPLMVTGNTNTPGNMCEAYFIGVSTSGNNKFHASSWNPATSTSGGGPSIQSYSINTWYHLTAIFDNDSVRIYINGNLDKSYFKGFSTNYSSLDSIIIGYSGNNTSNQRWFNGAIDDVKMYNRVLSASEVQSLYTKPFTCFCSSTPPPSDCDTTNLNTGKVLHLDFNGNTQDKSGNNYHATNFGATLVADRKGNANSAYLFNGVSSRMTVTNFSTSSSNNISISVWFKSGASSQQAYAGLLEHSHTTGTLKNWALQHSNTNSAIFFDWRNSTGNWAGTINDPVNYDHSKWNHLVVVKKTDTLYYYLNCILVFEKKYTGMDNIHKFVADLNIGFVQSNSGPIRYYNGSIAELRVYHRVLTLGEIKALGDCCSNILPPPPCDTSRRFSYTQCLNDSLQVTLRPGSQYQWSPKLGLSSDTARNPKIYTTINRTYLVSYLSTKGCQLVDTIEIQVKPAAIYPKIEDQLICIEDSVQIEIPIYATNILWSPNLSISSTTAKNPFFFPTTNRTYYLEFRDTFGCLQRDTFNINTKVCCPARARFTIPKDLLCFGETIAVTNTSKGPITSSNWNFSTAIPNTFTGANPPILTFPSGGTYSLRLIVTNGICFDTMIKTVNVVHIIPNAGKDTTNCLGAFVTDLGEAPISDWSYKWTPTKYLDDPNIANPKCSIVNDSVNYILEITDRNSGCKAYDTVVVYTNRKIDSTVQNLRICGGDSVLFNGVQRKTTGNYYFTLKKADGICDSFINVLRLNVLQKQMIKYIDTGVCEVYIDKKGRKYYDSFTEYDTIRSRSIPNCDSIINYRKINVNRTIYKSRTVSGCAPLRFNGKNYTVSKNKVDSLRTRSVMFPCDSIIEYVNVVVHPKPKAEITPSIPNPVMYKQTVTLTASGGQTYLWLQTGSTNQDIDYKINNTQPKLYTVRVTDENDCWDTVSYLIKGILPDTCYYGFPNVFSPNQDNLNDEYIPNMDECTEIKVFAIYDRWGEKVFETNQLKGWNGTFKGKPAQMGVYLYYAELSTPWGIRKHKGTFTLVR